MKTKHNIVIALAVLAAITAAEADSTHTWQSGETVVTFKNGTLTVSGKGKMADYYYGSGPAAMLDYGYYSRSLDFSPWSYIHDSVTALVIENGVTHIGEGTAQDFSKLTSVTIPASVTSIGSSAFEWCTGLTSVTIPNRVTSIEPMTFSGCTALKSVTIPNGVKSIKKWAFDMCGSLTSVTIPNSVTLIESRAFRDCRALASVTIPKGAVIEDYAFTGCVSLASPAYLTAAAADYCFKLNADEQELLLTRRYHELLVQMGEEPVMCEYKYNSKSVSSEIDFRDESGKSIASFSSGIGGGFWNHMCCGEGCPEEKAPYPLPRESREDPPEKMYRQQSWSRRNKMSIEEKDVMFKELLRFKDKIVEGHIKVEPRCAPHELEYKAAFRARITGECSPEFLDSRGERRRR